MKANEAPKSKFVYPDKLYARTNNNITLDISYAPQTLDAVEYLCTDAFIEKAISWLQNKFEDECSTYEEWEELIEDFKKALEEE